MKEDVEITSWIKEGVLGKEIYSSKSLYKRRYFKRNITWLATMVFIAAITVFTDEPIYGESIFVIMATVGLYDSYKRFKAKR